MSREGCPFAVVSAVNNETILASNLQRSPFIANGSVDLVGQRGYPSAALAYSQEGLSAIESDIIVFAHQDVYLPLGWDRRLLLAIAELEMNGRNWAVIGVAGMAVSGGISGRAWCAAHGCELGVRLRGPVPVVSLDEIVIVLKRSTGLRFDSRMPGFHLYGADIVQSARAAGYEAFVFDGPVIHNCRPVLWADKAYARAYRFMQRKWWNNLPIPTPCMTITKTGWPLFRDRHLRYLAKTVFRRDDPTHSRIHDPEDISRRLGYEFYGDVLFSYSQGIDMTGTELVASKGSALHVGS